MRKMCIRRLSLKERMNSLVFQITLGMLLLALFLLAVLGLSNMYSYQVVTRNTVETFDAGKSIYVGQLSANLNSITGSITEIAKASISDMQLYSNQPQLKRFFLQMEWMDRLLKRIDFTNAADFLFIAKPGEELILAANNKRVDSLMKISAIDYFRAQKEYHNDTLSEKWHIAHIDNVPCLVQTFQVYGFFVGGAVRFSTLFEELPRELIQKEVQYLLTGYNGDVLYSYGENYLDKVEKIDNHLRLHSNYRGKWFLLTEDLGFLRLTMAKQSDAIYLGLEWSFWLILGLGAVCFALIVVGSVYIYNQIIKPVNELYIGTGQLEKGNFEYRVAEIIRPQEFAALTRSFNAMAGEIVSLKIASYEAEIDRRRNELRFLQMQIRPHFYLNAITTISSFAYQNRGEALQAYTEALSKYMRYLFRDGASQTTIRDETEHVCSFIELNRIKNPERIYAMTHVDDLAQDVMIPKYLLLTLIENIFKHVYRQDMLLTIFLNAVPVKLGDEDFIHICVEDNGSGFPTDVLEKFPPEASEKRIGLGNLYRMLTLNYGREDLMRISNETTGGARVDIHIPIPKEA